MLIEVIPTVDELKADALFQKTVIVVDILRTSSTIITALANGSSYLIPTETIGQARALKEKYLSLLAGERYYKKIQSFDLGNSPLEYTKEVVYNKPIILSTSNGTRAIIKALKGEEILIGGFLNGEECMKHALSTKRDIVILCAGGKNEFALEDGLAAGFLIDQTKQLYEDIIEMDDIAKAMYGLYKYYEKDLLSVLMSSNNAKKLAVLGYEGDVHYSCERNKFSICPYVNENHKIMIR